MTFDIVQQPYNIWFTSDNHWGHGNFLNFMDEVGNKIRPFKSVQEMDDCMITRWNERVRPFDRVYHLGDVGSDSTLNNKILPKLHGSKRLIIGNHDTIKGDLVNHFKKITLWRLFKEYNFICSHLPLREDSMFKVTYCAHGHIHQQPSPSIRHINMCVENTGYAPVHLDELLAEIRVRDNLVENNIPYTLVGYDYKVKF